MILPVQAKHDDFSDVPVIVPFGAKRIVNLRTIEQLSVVFLADRLSEELAKEPRRDKEVGERKGKKHLVGKFGEVLVHA